MRELFSVTNRTEPNPTAAGSTPYLPEPVGRRRTRRIERLDHARVRHVGATTQIYEISRAVHRRASSIGYSGLDELPAGRHGVPTHDGGDRVHNQMLDITAERERGHFNS